MFNLAVINGRLHWRHKDENGETLFYARTKEIVVPEALWTHVAATYNSDSGTAKIYVNGLLKQQTTNPEKPLLSETWSSGTIGDHLPEHRLFDGLLDEFLMYNWELDSSEVGFVLKYCADHPKLVSFTVRVPLLQIKLTGFLHHFISSCTYTCTLGVRESDWLLQKDRISCRHTSRCVVEKIQPRPQSTARLVKCGAVTFLLGGQVNYVVRHFERS